MKLKILFGLIALVCISGCKKDNPIIEPQITIEKEDALEYAKDSISYNIDGITYKGSTSRSFSGGSNDQPYSKVDSIVGNAYYISGRKDSVLYTRNYVIGNDTQKVGIIFIKTYNKASMVQSIISRPGDVMDLFTVGSRNYVLDYERDKIQNGVVLNLENGFKTDSYQSFRTPLLLNSDAQINSKFEITSLKKLKSGTYILEAKFNAMVYNHNNVSKKLENGYLRLVMHKNEALL